jgi:acyl-CoA synthetase (AMP-forming)/AMP-acid ligase II
MTGYWKDEEKTKKTIDKDGWVHTGDMGYKDEAGYYFLAGRATDLIIRGGENISPEEVENIIFAHPKIDDVAVIGVPDDEWGEVPKAICVVKKGCEDCTPEEIMEHCRKNLASY